MKRLLCIVSSMNAGGAETFLMKMYRQVDRNKYQMDFCVAKTSNLYQEEIESMGGKLYFIPTKKKHPLGSFLSIRKIVKENGYRSVMRVNQHALSTVDLLAAKSGGAERLIMRSSNASSSGTVSKMLHRIFSFLPRIVPDVKLAPSTEAAEYTFGNGCVKNGKAILLHNAVDVEYFSYRDSEKQRIREEFQIKDKFIVGHVGRFNQQKNHGFLLDIFAEVSKYRDNAVLLLVGKGELEQSIRNKVEELGLKDKVIFTGVRQDIPALLSAMDVYVFPSFYEGMPNAVIEAQANGLHCIISDTITKEANITGLVEYLSLTQSTECWAKCVLQQDTEHIDTQEKFARNKYDIQSVTDEFVNIVFEREERNS